MRATSLCLCGLLILMTATIIGCGDDSENPTAPAVGAITVNPEPNSINATWQMTGPNGFTKSAAGDAVLADMTAGSYTLTWGTVAGWATPNPLEVTGSLAGGETLTFAGTYVVQVGTISIDAEPNSINAPWQISGPGGFSQSGTGDTSLADMIAGSYALTWGAVPGWTTPSPAAVTQTLVLGGVVTFAGPYIVVPLVPEFVSIPAGTFMMGSPTTESLRYANETQHQVTLTHGFYMQNTEVTNEQYRDMAQWAYDNGYVTVDGGYLFDMLDGSAGLLTGVVAGQGFEITFSAGVFSCIRPTHPVGNVTWYGSAAYCDWLSLKNGLPRAYNHGTWQCNAGNPYMATGYRLPTEAEWEYACRAGTHTPFNTGSCLDAGTEANYDGRFPYTGCPTGQPYASGPVSVGNYPANTFGLYDMHGNLFEWCNDWFDAYNASGGAVTDPVGPWSSTSRVIRGGDWENAQYCRSAFRNHFNAYLAWRVHGFRPVRSTS